MKYRLLLFVLILMFAIGCGYTYTEGTRFDEVKRNGLIKGGTTSADVVSLLGKPAQIEKVPAGGEKYIYNYYDEAYVSWRKLPRYDKQRLEVFIKDGSVQNYVFIRESRGIITEQDQKTEAK